jgi:GntR family galactonate operon transcriptional repressor
MRAADLGRISKQVVIASPFDDFVRQHGSTPRRGVFGMIVHDLGRRIVGGEFAAGEALPNEDDLIARFRVSRSTFREAMKTLASKGMVEIRTKTGTRVRRRTHWHHTDPDVMVWNYETGPSQEFLDALVDLRRVLEPAAAARAAERATETEIARIVAAYDSMCESIGDVQAHGYADREFHGVIFAASHNLILARMIDLIAIGIYGNTVRAPRSAVEGQRKSLLYHKDVLRAIQARDATAAAAAAHRLLDTWHPVAGRASQTAPASAM